MAHREKWHKKYVQIVGSITKQTSQLEKTRLLITALLFKESNTKQEYVLTNVGTSSLVLLDRPYGPQMAKTRKKPWGFGSVKEWRNFERRMGKKELDEEMKEYLRSHRG